MAFNYQNDIDSMMENYPLKLHNALTYITAKFRKENYEYVILLLTSTRDAAARVPRPPSNQYKFTCYIAKYIAKSYKMIDKCMKFPPRRPLSSPSVITARTRPFVDCLRHTISKCLQTSNFRKFCHSKITTCTVSNLAKQLLCIPQQLSFQLKEFSLCLAQSPMENEIA